MATFTSSGSVSLDWSDYIPESYAPGNLYANPDMIAAYTTGEGEEPASAAVSDVADSNVLRSI